MLLDLALATSYLYAAGDRARLQLRQRQRRRTTQHRAVAEPESRAVPGTDDLAVFDGAFVEWPTSVGAGVLECADLAGHAGQQDFAILDVDNRQPSLRHICVCCHVRPFRGARYPSVVIHHERPAENELATEVGGARAGCEPRE